MNKKEKEEIELNIEAKYVGRTEKQFLNNITYAECLYILDTKNNYCDEIRDLSLLKLVDIISKQQKEIERFNNELDLDYVDKNFIPKDKIREKMQEYYEKASPYDCDTADYKQSQEIGGWNALRKLLEE